MKQPKPQAIQRYESPPPTAMQFQVSVKIDLNEMTRTLKPEQIAAVMQGIAKVIAVQNEKRI